MAEGKLFLLKNNGALHTIDKRTGKLLWKRKLGVLAAASPAYGNGRLFVTLLSRGKNKPGAVYALDPKNGKILWTRLLPSRSESSPVFDNDRIYFGSENGTVYALRAGDGGVRWKFKAAGAVKAGARAGQRQALLRRLQRPRLRDPPGRRRPGLEHRHQGRRLRAALGHVLLDPRGRLRPRLHRQHRRQDVLVRVRQRQAGVVARAPARTSTPPPPSRSCRG